MKHFIQSCGIVCQDKVLLMRTCQFSISNTVLQHNDGYTTASMISELGLQAGSNITAEYFQNKDKKRKRGASRTPRKKSKKEDQDISYRMHTR
ncbi:hypothetical protein Pcinc_006504 [Petrolisthes cinctipes]|uniref:Uncharacterized protein n=1 Tax=Petrolisthes cinctipes TaxID=88211 RepID=A0AAE1GD04_PETCI|nr:hypothetical protein Pcinc_006504 [Petrolisthes cinctipes]